MEEDEIAIRFDRRKLDALKVALYAEGKDLDQALEKYIGLSLIHISEPTRRS